MKKSIAVLVATMMLFVVFGCQSTEAPAATTEVVAPAAPEAAPAPAPAPAPVEEAPAVVEPANSVSETYEYLGYELSIEAADGKAVISYPDWVQNADVEAFFAAEVAKYGAQLDGVLYMFTAPGTVEVAYPAEASADLVSAYIDGFIADLLAFVEPLNIQPAV